MHVINLENIRSIANSVDMYPIIKRITPPRALRPANRPQAFPPLQRPLQQGMDWWKFRGEPQLIAENQALLYAIAKSTRAWMICATCIGWGEELYAMVRGAYDAGYTEVTAHGYDPEEAFPGSLEWVRECLMADRLAYNLSHSSLHQYDASGLPISYIDLFQLDCLHSAGRLGADCKLALKTLSPKGIIVLTSVRNGVLPAPEYLVGPAGEDFNHIVPIGEDMAIICRETQVPK